MTHRLEQTLSDFDILYVAAIWQWIGISTCRMARRRHIPHVVSPDGSFLGPALRRHRLRKLIFWHGFLTGCIEAADAIRFTTESERRGSMGFLPEKTSFVVPNPVVVGNGGLPKGRGDAGSRGRLGFARDSLVLLAVTRAHPNKRLDVVIEALALIRRAGRDARLLIAGPFDNAYGDRLKVLADRRQVSHAIVWAGYQSGAALDACYRASDLFVLPSAHENFCMAAAEAMAHGLPLVVSKHVGIAEDVEHHGAGVVTDVDVRQVADAVLSLVNADRRLEMGTRAREMVADLYSPARVSRLMVQAFRDLLSGSRSSECAWQ
jgi:glycosyltransferase involved in cell wall biosynthesis